MQYVYYCLVFLSTVSVAVLFEVKKVYVIERDVKTGLLRARRQNIPAPSHTMARIGGLQDHHLHHHHQHQQQQPPPHMQFTVAVSPPPLQSLTAAAAAGGQQQLHQQHQQPAQDLASSVDLTTAADSRAPIDYLTPPPSADFPAHNFAAHDSMVRAESHQFPQNAAVQTSPVLGPFAAPAPAAVPTSSFTPVVGFSGAAPPPPPPPASLATQAVQTSSPSNQVHSLTFASPPLEQFTPYTPTLVQNDPPPPVGHLHHPQSHQLNGGRWELGYDANDILTPPFAISTPEQPPGTGHLFYQQDFGQEAAASSSVRNNKQFVGGGGGGGGLFFGSGGGGGGGSYDTAISSNSNKFTPSDAVVRASPSNKNVYWGTPKSAQQLPLRPPALYAETNAYRYNNNNNNNNNNNHQHHQYVDAFQMPFTGQFDGPLSQGTVADHVVHTSFRIKRQLDDEGPSSAARRADGANEDADAGGYRKPVYSYVKTDRNGNFKWSVRQGYY